MKNLVPLEYEKGGVHISGFTSLPHEQRRNASNQFLYVNRRIVKDRVLAHAIRMAYQDLIPTKSYPTIILFVKVNPKEIDVNVHPAKTEIRFNNSSIVHRAVQHSIEYALSNQKEHLFQQSQEIQTHGIDSINTTSNISSYFDRHSKSGVHLSDFSYPSSTSFQDITLNNTFITSHQAHSDNIPITDYISQLPVALGQFVESFIVATDREGVILVDQHVAHERIIYDQAISSMESPENEPTQRLLVPLTFELNVQQKIALTETLEHFNANGFEVEQFGRQSIVVKGVPAFAKECDADALIQEILEGWNRTQQELTDKNALVKRLQEKVAISLSCRAAIKINTPLTQEKLQWLLDELFRCQNPFTCPHGRPIILRVGIEDILHGFKRI